MPKEATLADLYRRGKEVTVTDDTDSENPISVTVYMKKLNPLEGEKAIRRANAERARLLREAKDEESDLYLEILGDVYDKLDDELLEILAVPEIAKRSGPIMEELAAEDEWAENDYLQGLRDSWSDSLMESWIELGAREDDLNDEEKELFVEAEKVFDELKRYQDAAQELIEKERASYFRAREKDSRESLEEEAFKLLIEEKANEKWLAEFNKQRIYFATKKPNKTHEQYFANSDAVLETIELEVYVQLIQAYEALEVSVQEGKLAGDGLFLSMVGAAISGGNGSLLWPKGCKTIEDVPQDLALAVQHATKINTWYDNLMEDEVPPQWMWPFDEELKEWFKGVKQARKAGSSGEAADDDEMEENELAADYR